VKSDSTDDSLKLEAFGEGKFGIEILENSKKFRETQNFCPLRQK
jgi:hypothetical protein